MDYNTEREKIVINEYGRHIQDMIDYMASIKEPEKRQKNAEAIVEVMSILNPHHAGVEGYKQRFWDHIYEILDYDLEIDSPYGTPSPKEMRAKPDRMAYPQSRVRWNHLGKNIEQLFKKAMDETDEAKVKGYIQVLAFYMKIAYKNYHDENINDDAIKEELLKMSNGKLVYENNEFRKHVDGTLSESATVINIRNHRMNENMAQIPTGRHRGGNNNNNRSNNNNNNNGNNNFRNNRFKNNNFKNKR